MADQTLITLYQGEASDSDVKLRSLPVADVPSATIVLTLGQLNPSDIQLGPPGVPPSAILGQSAQTAAGFLGVDIQVPLVGQSATATQGSIEGVLDQPLTGLVATTAQGQLGTDVTNIPIYMLVGLENPSDILLLVPEEQPSWLLGRRAFAIAGQLGIDIQVAAALTGQAATTAQGTLTNFVGGQLVGQPATTAQGSLGADIKVPLIGLVATTAQGALVPAIEAPRLVGQQIVTAAGSVGLSRVYGAPTGQRATTAAGVLGVEIQAVPAGVQAEAAISNAFGLTISSPVKKVVGVQGVAATAALGNETPEIDTGALGVVAVDPVVVQHQATSSFDYAGWAIKRQNLSNLIDLSGNQVMAVGIDLNNNTPILGIAPDSVRGITRGKRADVSTLHPFTGANINVNNPALDPAFNGLTFQLFPDNTHYDHAPDSGLGGYMSIGPSNGGPHYLSVRSLDWAAGDPTPPAIYYCYQPGTFNTNYRGPEIVRNLTFDGLHESPMGLYAIDDFNALVFYPVKSGTNWIPAYRTVNQPDSTTDVTIGAEVQLSVTGCFALHNFLVVARADYDNTIYVVYLSAANGSSATPTKIGLIVMDAVTLTVTSHTLTNVPTAATTWDLFTDQRNNVVTGIPGLHRPNAKVIKLGGSCISQFLIGGYVVRLSWTNATTKTPTLTLKNGPTSDTANAHYLIPGWESLEVKGGEAYHLIFEGVVSGSDSQFRAFRYWINDATGTGSTWTLTPSAGSSALFSFTEFCGASVSYKTTWLSSSSDGEGAKTFLFSCPHDDISYNTTFFNTWAWFDYWNGQAPYLSVSAEGRVGNVTTTIENNVSSIHLPAGQRATATAGVLVPEVAPLLITIGLRATTDVGYITGGAGGDVIGGLVGNFAVGSEGTLVPAISVQLTGQAATTRQGGFPFDTVAGLSGEAATATEGVLVPEISVGLTGQRATASAGSLIPSTAVNLSGLQAVGSPGSVQASLDVSLVGQAAASAPGALLASLEIPVAGRRAVGRAGTIAPEIGALLAGLATTGSPGQLGTTIGALLTGQTATGLGGLLGLIVDATVNVTGVEARGKVGVVTTDLPPVPPEWQLWAQQQVDKLFGPQFVPVELYNDTDPME